MYGEHLVCINKWNKRNIVCLWREEDLFLKIKGMLRDEFVFVYFHKYKMVHNGLLFSDVISKI